MFVSISRKAYIKKHLKINPDADKKELENGLKRALADFKKGVKCYCGNDIWVIGSAIVGNKCFTCMTGEAMPDSDYELAEALPKNILNKKKWEDKGLPSFLEGDFFDD